ncbi:hypothetical protein RAS1_08040 [Phycisphaerae bacterium RAS1]|nr:hypothetical protein RAS1_08040 [Phycisphaerae bacterium RAS1]
MDTFIEVLAFVMTLWMLYCFTRHGIYPAIRLVFRMIGAVVRFFARQLWSERSDAVAEHVAEVCASPLTMAPNRQQTDHD